MRFGVLTGLYSATRSSSQSPRNCQFFITKKGICVSSLQGRLTHIDQGFAFKFLFPLFILWVTWQSLCSLELTWDVGRGRLTRGHQCQSFRTRIGRGRCLIPLQLRNKQDTPDIGIGVSFRSYTSNHLPFSKVDNVTNLFVASFCVLYSLLYASFKLIGTLQQHHKRTC